MKKVRIPLGDGSSNLQEIDQSYILVAAELLDFIDGEREEPSKGIKSFAKNVLFEKVLADKEVPVQSLSLGLNQQLSDVLYLFGRQELTCMASDYRPHKSTPFASLHLSFQKRSVSVWFAPSEPFVELEIGGEPPKFKPMFPSTTAVEAPAPKPKLRFSFQSDTEDKRPSNNDIDSTPKRVRHSTAAFDPERFNYWEQQLERIGHGGAPQPPQTKPMTPSRPMTFEEQIQQRYAVPNLPLADLHEGSGMTTEEFYERQINARWNQ
jgi:hypothetical protein